MPIKLHIDEKELYNDKKNEFFKVKAQDVTLEHSLISISKWESKWHIPFVDEKAAKKRTVEQSLDYFRFMSINPDVDPNFVFAISQIQAKKLQDYINDPMTATTISYIQKQKHKKEIITSELVYYWMTAYQIPFSCEKWHFNRLMKLIELCAVKNDPKAYKGMKKNDILRNNYAGIMANRAKMGLH